jgi:hypothetical protein
VAALRIPILRDRQQPADPVVPLERSHDLPVGRDDLPAEVVDQPQVGGEPGCGDRRQGQGLERCSARAPEQIGCWHRDPRVCADRVDLALEPRADPDEGCPHPDQPAELADLGWRDPRLGQEVSAQEVGEGRGVDRVVLDPTGTDRLGRERMGHVGLDARVGEQVGEPAPAVRRLEGDADRLGLELPEHPPERVPAVVEPSRQDRRAGLVEGHHVADLAVRAGPRRCTPLLGLLSLIACVWQILRIAP